MNDNTQSQGGIQEHVINTPIDRCKEYARLLKDNPRLAKRIRKLDTELDNLMAILHEYDKELSAKDKESEWRVKLFRCRLVLGMD